MRSRHRDCWGTRRRPPAAGCAGVDTGVPCPAHQLAEQGSEHFTPRRGGFPRIPQHGFPHRCGNVENSGAGLFGEGGKRERGGTPPLSQKEDADRSELAAARPQRAREFRSRHEVPSGPGRGPSRMPSRLSLKMSTRRPLRGPLGMTTRAAAPIPCCGGGKCERGGCPPFHKKKALIDRNSPQRATSAQGSFDPGAKRRAAPGGGFPECPHDSSRTRRRDRPPPGAAQCESGPLPGPLSASPRSAPRAGPCRSRRSDRARPNGCGSRRFACCRIR